MLLCQLNLPAGTTIDLDTINGGAAGQLLTLKKDSTASLNVIVKHNTGNVLLGGGSDVTLDHQADRILLQYDGDISKWVEIASGSNS